MSEPKDTTHAHSREVESYWDRVRRIFHMLDFRQAFITADQALQAVKELEELKAQAIPNTIEQKQRISALEHIRNAAVHPQTGQPIFLPLRLSMIVPANIVMDGLMLGARTPAQVIMAQWVNQSYNALHYHANRNTTNEESITQRASAYLAATSGSVWIAYRLKQAASPRLRLLAPFLAVACADILNLSIMRKSEFLSGVHVYDADTEELIGTSQRAGILATSSCIVARVAAAFPILAGTPAIMLALERNTSFLKSYPRARFPVMLGTVGLMIQLAVPVTFGVFRQDMMVSTSLLEPTIAESGARKVFFNRGL